MNILKVIKLSILIVFTYISLTYAVGGPGVIAEPITFTIHKQQRAVFTWDTVNVPDLTGYNLYINDELLIHLAPTVTTYTYDIIDDGTYVFVVRSTDNLTESYHSDTITIIKNESPPAPTNFNVTLGDL